MLRYKINGKDIDFKFSIRFVRALNTVKTVKYQGIEMEQGLNFVLGELFADASTTALLTILQKANLVSGGELITEAELEDWLDDESTDIEQVINDVIKALEEANATKLKVQALLEKKDKSQDSQGK